jgi:hypothetical protein
VLTLMNKRELDALRDRYPTLSIQIRPQL